MPSNEEIAKWLDEAADLISDWGAYAGDYFKWKHHLADDVARFHQRAQALRTGGVKGGTDAP
jgi:hypothetical protein